MQCWMNFLDATVCSKSLHHHLATIAAADFHQLKPQHLQRDGIAPHSTYISLQLAGSHLAL